MRLVILLLLPPLLVSGRRESGADEERRRSRQLSPDEVSELLGHLRAGSLRLRFSLAQEPKTHATLLALYSRPRRRSLELQANAKRGYLKATFRTLRRRLSSVTAPVKLKPTGRQEISLLISGQRLALSLDCAVVFNQSLSHLDLSELDGALAEPSAYLGRRESHHFLLHGSIGDFTMGPYSIDHLQHCEKTSSGRRPKAAQKTTSDMVPKESEREREGREDSLDYLKHRVGYLETEFRKWRDTVQNYESQLRSVQLHQRGCGGDGAERRRDGERWQRGDCTHCVCHQGRVHCHREGCPTLNCTSLLRLPDSCCPVCASSCSHEGRQLEHGERWRPDHDRCVECRCDDGRVKCRFGRSEDCPSLDCPESKQKLPPHSCCPVCEGADFCGAEEPPCAANATCTNRRLGPECGCAEGFHGDGREGCWDLDECAWDEGLRKQLGGCGPGTRCINTPGSFRCDCLPGFVRIDERNCLDLVFL